MADIIKMDIPMVEETVEKFKLSQQHIEDLKTMAARMAAYAEEGALWGSGGAAFVEGLQGRVLPVLDQFSEKLTEMIKDLQDNIQIFQETDTDVGRYYA